jgi:hypothetical protein
MPWLFGGLWSSGSSGVSSQTTGGLAGSDLFAGFARFLGEMWPGTTTSAGASDGSTIIDTELSRYGTETITNSYVILLSGAQAYSIRRVKNYAGGVVTFTHVLPAQVATAVDYMLLPHDPVEMLRALDRARFLAYPELAIIRMDETMTGDGENKELPIPAALRRGPVEVWREELMSPTAGWNALSDSALNASSGNWTASGPTVSIYEKNNWDLLVPKHETNCVKLVGSGSYAQTVANMQSGVTASGAAGRRVTFGAWVYQKATSGTATVKIQHDTATVTSPTHGGAGWQLLEVSATIPSSNTTTLTVSINTGANVTIFAEHAFLIFADKLPQKYSMRLTKRGIWRDGTNAEVLLNVPPDRGYQLRLIGRAPLSALGETFPAAFTNTMEIDTASAELLYAKAARVLLIDEGWSAGRIDEEVPRIAEVEARFKDGAINWGFDQPMETKINGWWNQTRGT